MKNPLMSLILLINSVVSGRDNINPRKVTFSQFLLLELLGEILKLGGEQILPHDVLPVFYAKALIRGN